MICENLRCEQYSEGECAAAGMVRNQADTIGNPRHAVERLTKRQLGRVISDYETKVANKFCNSTDEALRLALQYARNIHERMPEDAV